MASRARAYKINFIEGLDARKEKGRGSYGAVYEVRVNGVPCIAKRLHDILVGRGGQEPVGPEQSREAIRRFHEECDLLSNLRHPNVVQFMGVHYGHDEADISLIMEYMHMDLDHCMETYPNIPLPYKTRILRDVAYGLAYLHSISIIHRDLNAGNVLLTESLRAKIADLGVAKLFDREIAMKRTRTVCPGAPDFMSPESLSRSPKYSDKLDVFSFGHLAIYLVNQEAPIVEDSTITDLKQVQVGKRCESLNQMPDGPRHPLYATVVQCLSDTPDQRPTSRDLVRRMEELCNQYSIAHKNNLESIANVKHQITEAEKHKREAEEQRREAEKHKREAEEQRREAEKHKREAEEQRREAEKHKREAEEQRRETEKHKREAEEHRREAEELKIEAEEHRREADVLRNNLIKMKQSLDESDRVANMKQQELDKRDQIIDELRTELGVLQAKV